MKISICIPTYNRLDLLKEAFESCCRQSLLPYEIIIGDDSNNSETEEWVESAKNSLVRVRYFHHKPSLRQAKNVNFIFEKAEGELVMLLHDDDTLLPTALEKLHACFLDHPEIDIAFGKQYLMTHSGEVQIEASKGLNRDYYRDERYAGSVLSSLEAGLLQQIPNDGYLIRSAVLKETKYNPGIGDACDFEFGLKLGVQGHKIFFLNEYTANYRISDVAVSNSAGNDAALVSYLLAQQTVVSQQSDAYKDSWLREKVAVALAQSAMLGHTGLAARLFFSKYHQNKIATPGGIKRLLLVILSLFKPKKTISVNY